MFKCIQMRDSQRIIKIHRNWDTLYSWLTLTTTAIYYTRHSSRRKGLREQFWEVGTLADAPDMSLTLKYDSEKIKSSKLPICMITDIKYLFDVLIETITTMEKE